MILINYMGEDELVAEPGRTQMDRRGREKKTEEKKKKKRALYKMVTLIKQHLSRFVNIQRGESFISIQHGHNRFKRDAA